MTARALRRKAASSDAWRNERRPAFHLPANDNGPVVSRRIVAWVMMAAGFAAIAAVIGTGF